MGPLAGIRVLEFAGIGPGPMAAMLLADLGADVVRLERPEKPDTGAGLPPRFNPLLRSRRVLTVDLKDAADRGRVDDLVERADVLIEGFRPGVMERLGLGPEPCLARNPRLVYGRMTGWGQTGPLAHSAGHDLNYIALAGALHATGRKGQPPTPPLNLVGDFGGGSLYLVVGLLAALMHARETGRGQVVDAAMVDGAASLMAAFFGMRAAGMMTRERGTNVLDSGAFFYDSYRCQDGHWIAVAAIEPKFFAQLLERLELDPDTMPAQADRTRWEEGRAVLAGAFARRTRDDWCRLFEGSDCCVAPVLDIDEAPLHPHAVARDAFVDLDGVIQPRPCPRFTGTPLGEPRMPSTVADFETLLRDWHGPSRTAAGV